MDIKSIVVIGVHSSSFRSQETEAAEFLAKELGPGHDISCSYELGHSGFLERENAAILNGSIRRFAKQVVAGLRRATKPLVNAGVFVTLNDGTISHASYAAQYPLKCFSSGPTNSARGAAFLSNHSASEGDDTDVIVIDVGGTTTDICSLLPTGYPKQSAASVKIAGVKTNYSMPDVHSITLGTGTVVRGSGTEVTVGPDSISSEENTMSLLAGGSTITVSDLSKLDPGDLATRGVATDTLAQAKAIINQLITNAVDFSKTKITDAKVLLVGGGSFILPDKIAGTSSIVRPPYFQVANAVGAAIGKISGAVDKIVLPAGRGAAEMIDEGKRDAIALCVEAGGCATSVEIVEVETIAETYSMNGAFRLLVRAISDISDATALAVDRSTGLDTSELDATEPAHSLKLPKGKSRVREVPNQDLNTYKPDIQGDVWNVSETDIDFLISGTGVLGVGCIGEASNYEAALKTALRDGRAIRIVSPEIVLPDDVICPALWIGAPTIFLERLPGLKELPDAIYSNLSEIGKSDFSYTVPSEIGGPNALEALLLASQLGKAALDADLMGRAFPRAYMTVLGIQGIKLTPAAMSDGNGNIVKLKDAKDDFAAEEILRANTGALKSIAGLCLRPLIGEQSKLIIQNSFSLAWMIGRSMNLAWQNKADVAQSIVDNCNGKVLFAGKVHSVSQEVESSFTRGTCTILPAGDYDSVESCEYMDILYENEISAAILKCDAPGKKKEEYVGLTPDLITILDAANGMPIGVTQLRYGLRVTVIAMPAPSIWYTPEGMRRGGPSMLGLPGDMRSVSGLEPSEVGVASVFELYN